MLLNPGLVTRLGVYDFACALARGTASGRADGGARGHSNRATDGP